MGELRITRGVCRPLYVFEIGNAVDLDAAAERLLPGTDWSARARPAGPRPNPLRATQEVAPDQGGGLRLDASVEIALYDFGAASVSYAVPLPTGAGDLLALSMQLRSNDALLGDARRRITGLIAALGSSVQRPWVAELVEDYFLFEVSGLPEASEAGAFCEEHADLLARVLRGEETLLSREEVAHVLQARISFGRNDLILVDWDAAFILDPDPADIRTVLEFANVQLLELRYLDGQLDQVLERAYQLLSRRSRWRAIAPGFMEEDRRELSALQVDSAILLERVTNALKVLGEEYLARVYRLAASRLHLADWDAAIVRKLSTVESIYQKISDRAAARRLELLEWVVIVLIALEVILALRH